MPKPKKDKIITFDSEKFRIQTTVHGQNGSRTRTLIGEPTISVGATDIRIGCIHLTYSAFEQLMHLWNNRPIAQKTRFVFQKGNYGDPE